MPDYSYPPRPFVEKTVNSGASLTLDDTSLGYEVARRSFRILHKVNGSPSGNLLVEGSLDGTAWVTLATLASGEHTLVDASVVPWPFLRLTKQAGHNAAVQIVGKHIDVRLA